MRAVLFVAVALATLMLVSALSADPSCTGWL